MIYIISDDCISCGACAEECPAQCITQGEDIYVIDEDCCIGCGNCAQVCPVGAPREKN